LLCKFFTIQCASQCARMYLGRVAVVGAVVGEDLEAGAGEAVAAQRQVALVAAAFGQRIPAAAMACRASRAKGSASMDSRHRRPGPGAGVLPAR